MSYWITFPRNFREVCEVFRSPHPLKLSLRDEGFAIDIRFDPEKQQY
jgi:hypothetical protein